MPSHRSSCFIALSFKNDSFSGVTSAILRVGSCSIVYLGLDLIFACVQVFEIFNGHLLKVALDKYLANDFMYASCLFSITVH